MCVVQKLLCSLFFLYAIESGSARGVVEYNNNNNNFIQYYLFVPVLPIKITITKWLFVRDPYIDLFCYSYGILTKLIRAKH